MAETNGAVTIFKPIKIKVKMNNQEITTIVSMDVTLAFHSLCSCFL